MSRLVAVPDFGDSGPLCQQVEVSEPGEPGYPTPLLPESDPWAAAVNPVIREVAAEAEADAPVPYTLTPRAEAALDAGPAPDTEPWQFPAAAGPARPGHEAALTELNACQLRVEAGPEPEAEP